MVKRLSIIAIIISSLIWCAEESAYDNDETHYFDPPASLGKIGDYSYPTNPSNDRAMGLAIKGKTKSTILNYGDFIDIDVDRDGQWDQYPAGLWGEYAYLPQVGFMAGVPGNYYSYKFTDWNTSDSEVFISNNGENIRLWWSDQAGRSWLENGADDPSYVGVLFESYKDRGIVGVEIFVENPVFTDKNQWMLDVENQTLFITVVDGIDPQVANSYGNQNQKKSIGLIYPWAMRPSLTGRNSNSDFDYYDYAGCDEFEQDWTTCENMDYYGANVSESWYKRRFNTDWQPSTKARIYTHNTIVNSGDVFGNTPYVPSNDEYPLLAHSNFTQTWPTVYNEETGLDEPFWPGWFAEDYIEDLPGCTGTRKDPNCWTEVNGRFISDSDIFMEFDDRWAHRGSNVNTSGGYEEYGYPLGLRVQAEAHSYGIAYAEDVMFVTVKVRNESGDFYDEEGNFHDGIILPDGTKINGGKGFNYKGMSLGFYFDADSYSQDVNGSTAGRSNDDDTMEYYDSIHVVNNEELIISMAMVYDYDGTSGLATGSDLGVVGVQLLDSPIATDTLYKEIHGIDRLPGQKLKMTDWHWFNWYNRPGVESPGIDPPTASHKEEVQYKLMTGDTTNISQEEKEWYFHTANPATDLDIELNPHFDSLDGLELEQDFLDGELGLDAVLIMSCGPFDIEVGEEVPFSFTIIFGQDPADLIRNAEFAQIMYNSHYQGFTAPTIPNVFATVDHERIVLTWDAVAENSRDVITGYSDFEGYRIYKSLDGGSTWGDPEDMIFDNERIHVGWEPLDQFDLTFDQDMNHCIYENADCSDDLGNARQVDVQDNDPLAPWFDLGDNTGLQHTYVDTNVIDGVEYTYSVTAYDMGVEADFEVTWSEDEEEIEVDVDGNGVIDTVLTITTWVPDTTWGSSNPDHWATPYGYASLETSKGTTIHDPNFVTVIPGYRATNITFPDIEESEDFIIANPGNTGNGDRFYSIVNEEDLSNKLVRLEVQAEADTADTFEGYALADPRIYVYEINNLSDQKPILTNGIEMVDMGLDSIMYYMDMPGADSSDGVIYVPDYEVKDYEILGMDDDGYESNFSDFFDGIRVRFDNGLGTIPADNSALIRETEMTFPPDSNGVPLVDIRLQYRGSGVFTQRPPYEYKIEFSVTSYLDSADITTGSGCEGTPFMIDGNGRVPFPFKITNLTTGKQVKIRHKDNGLGGQQAGDGKNDCLWQRAEPLEMYRDEVITTNNPDPFEEWIYTMYIDLPYVDFLSFQVEPWYATSNYEEGFMVYHADMIWVANDIITPSSFSIADGDTIKPNTWYDPDGDGVSDNKWLPVYPWEDGDYMIIKPARWFVDGDSWVADLSLLGEPHEVTQEELEMVKVVPNPYIVSSEFNESKHVKKMRFTHLPQQCKITIYTITGEKINELEHDDPYEGNLWWNLRTLNNQEVAPGLYIYTVESDGKKHIGKFAVVR